MKDLKKILELPDEEKFHLVELIWDSISSKYKDKAPLSAEQLRDLIKRNAEFEENPDEGISWTEAKKQIRSGKWNTR